jgi:hypothetical protein
MCLASGPKANGSCGGPNSLGSRIGSRVMYPMLGHKANGSCGGPNSHGSGVRIQGSRVLSF